MGIMTTSQVAPTTTLTLVRHGQTHLNSLRMLQGSCDSPLTPDGHAGVRVTGQHLSTATFDAAYTSPQQRAVTTAKELLRHHPHLTLRPDTDLREFSFGSYERRPEQDLDAVQPWAEFISAVLGGRHPGLAGGESGAHFVARVHAVFERILACHPGQRVLVVGHGLTLGAYLATISPAGLIALPNASVSTVEVRGGTPRILSAGVDVAGHGSLAARPAPVPA